MCPLNLVLKSLYQTYFLYFLSLSPTIPKVQNRSLVLRYFSMTLCADNTGKGIFDPYRTG
jgi:hypothetical protein